MPRRTISADPTKRQKTRYRGISYRERRDGTRTYSIYWHGTYVAVEGGENEALAKQAELRSKAARGEATVAPTKLTFGAVAEEWLASKSDLRPYTRLNYRATLDRILIPRFGSKRIACITAEDVAALIRDLGKQGLAATTVKDYLKPLTGTMGFAVRRRYRADNPYAVLTRDERPRAQRRKPHHVWDDDEMTALIEAAEHLARQPASRYDYTPLLRVALATGLRLGELLGLRWRDIDFDAQELNVEWQWTRLSAYAEPKTSAALRRVPLSPDVMKYLAEYKLRSLGSGDDDAVFASKPGKPLTHRNATGRGFEKAAEHAGIGGVSFHDMRHAFASRMISRGISSTVLARIMGHESAAITEETYIHEFDRERTDDAVREAMAR